MITVRRHFHKQSIYGSTAFPMPLVTDINIVFRGVTLAKTWSIDKWKKVIWSNESLFSRSSLQQNGFKFGGHLHKREGIFHDDNAPIYAVRFVQSWFDEFKHLSWSAWLWQRFQDDSNLSRCNSTGRPRVTTSNEDRYLAVTAKRSRQSTASDLSRQLSSATATHCRLRLTWSREHALWTPQQWSCVMFSNESRFSLQSDSRRTLIWRVPGTRYHQENTIGRHCYGDAGWLVWGGIILGFRTDLHV
ncbi:transposable element Tcb1 transposase [Trichonephila clavipes]|nr:transposable element Tcb1 transposase [Trichonephila clavipes]